MGKFRECATCDSAWCKPMGECVREHDDQCEPPPAAYNPAAVASLIEAAEKLISGVRARHPGEELRCPDMIALHTALTAIREPQHD